MIVISGALVLVALVLLVIGLIGPVLGFVYASIGASLAAFAFLVVGILQRRREEPVGIDSAPTSAADLASVIRTPETHPVTAEELTAASGITGEVLIVEGRPRYHVAGCRYLTGKDARTLEVGQARIDGFTACGVCKPDEALAAAPVASSAANPAVASEVLAVDEATPAVVTLPATPAAPAKAAKAAVTAKAPARATTAAPARKAAVKATAVVKAPAKAAPVKKATAAAKAPAKKAAPAKAAAAKSAATAAKAPAKAAAAKKVAAPAKKAAPAKATRATRG